MDDSEEKAPLPKEEVGKIMPGKRIVDELLKQTMTWRYRYCRNKPLDSKAIESSF